MQDYLITRVVEAVERVAPDLDPSAIRQAVEREFSAMAVIGFSVDDVIAAYGIDPTDPEALWPDDLRALSEDELLDVMYEAVDLFHIDYEQFQDTVHNIVDEKLKSKSKKSVGITPIDSTEGETLLPETKEEP